MLRPISTLGKKEAAIEFSSPSIVTVKLSGALSQEVTLSTFDPISSLLEEKQRNDFRLVFNGILPNQSLSLAFYGIKDGDIVFVVKNINAPIHQVRSSEVPDLTKQIAEHFDRNWAHRVADRDASLAMFRATANPETSMEKSRIMDMRKSKAEASVKRYRRICYKVLEQQQNIIRPKAEQIE